MQGRDHSRSENSVSDRGRMTAGRSILRSISWPGKHRRRTRSGSGGSQGGRTLTCGLSKGLSLQSITSIFSSKEQLSSPNQSIEFKCSWPVQRLREKSETAGGQGLDSRHFKIKINGVTTVWNLSIRFWINDQGEKIFNPFILCLNLVECKSSSDDPVEVTYKFNMFNRETEKYDEGAEGITLVGMDRRDQIQSVVVENITLKDEHCNEEGDILLQACFSYDWQPQSSLVHHRMPKYVAEHPAKPDLLVVSENRMFPVHKNVLAEVSPVLASLIEGLGEEEVNSHIDKIVIPSLDDSVAESLLRYIYTGSLPGSCLSSPGVLRACALYQLPGLQALCEEHLATLLSPTTVASILMLADTCSCYWLKGRALQYCKDQCAYLIKDQDWTIMEQENHRLWVEACRTVEAETCENHGQCVRNTRHLAHTLAREQCAR